MMKCKDCEYLHIKNPLGYSRAFCSHWECKVGEIKFNIRKCKFYIKKDIKKVK